jgi:hypothetical protein
LRRPTLQVFVGCNNACVFCAQRGTTRVDPDLAHLTQSLQTLRSSSDEVTFVGGEPTLSPHLLELVGEAARLGFKGIGLQTNGRVLADRSRFEALQRAGLTDIHLSIHGADAAVHDYHTGTPGSLTAIRQTLAHARSLRVAAVATTVLTRSNYRVLAALPPFLAGNGISAWLLMLPRVAGALVLEDRISPRLTMALQGARQAVDGARRARLSVWIEGAPACLLGPLQPFSLQDQPERAYAPVCETCPSRARCPGVDAAYLKRFAGDELVPRPVALEHFESPLTRLFVGIGELTKPEKPVPPPAPVIEPAVPPVTGGLVSLSVSKPT